MSALYFLLVSFAGWGTAVIFPFSLPKWLRFLSGPAIGAIVTSEVTLLVSLISGYSEYSILLSLALYLVFVVWHINKSRVLKHLIFNPRVTVQNSRTRWSLVVILLIFGSLAAFFYLTKVLYPTPDGLQTGGGGLYADTALHSSYTMSIVERGLPPKNPLYGGIPLVYPFMVNLFSANLVKLDSSLHLAFAIPHLFYFAAFVALFYAIARSFTSNTGAFLAMLIFFLGWGLGFINYFGDVSKTKSFEVTKEYTNDSESFYMHNPLTGLIFPERSFLPGLTLGMLYTYLILQLDPRKLTPIETVLLAILLGIMPLWHTHTFLFIGIMTTVWFGWYFFTSSTSVKQTITQNGIILACVCGLLLIPVYFYMKGQVSHAFLEITGRWIRSDKRNLVEFWFYNSGLLIPLAAMGLYKLKFPKLIFFFPAVIVFILANTVQFQPWDWDNIKLLSWAFLFFAILAGSQLAHFFSKGRPYSQFALVILFTLVASGILSIAHQLPQTYIAYDNADIEMATWVGENTKPDDIFLIDPWPTHPIPGLTGRSVYLGYPGHLWVHGIDYRERQRIVEQVLTGDLTLLQDSDIPVRYMTVPANHESLFSGYPELVKVYDNNKFAIFQRNGTL